jgi:N-acetylglutamate synthase-like GNAT family acetyltransferase
MPPDASSRDSAGFVIRRAANADIPAIREVLLSVRREFNVHYELGGNDPDISELEAAWLGRGGDFLVVENRDRGIVGCAGLRPLTGRRAELCKMYLEEPARGHGLGRRMLEMLLAVARQNGFSEVWLETNSGLTAAAALYRSHGFEPVEPDHLLPKCDQAFLLRLE